MTVAAQALSDVRRGAALVARFKNAIATFPGGTTVEGVFERAVDRATLGGLSVNARDITFEAITADLPARVSDGTRLTVAMGDTPAVSVGTFAVKRGGRFDDYEDRVTLLELESA